MAPRVGWVPIAWLLFPDTPSLRHTAPVLLNIPDSPFIAALAEATGGSLALDLRKERASRIAARQAQQAADGHGDRRPTDG